MTAEPMCITRNKFHAVLSLSSSPFYGRFSVQNCCFQPIFSFQFLFNLMDIGWNRLAGASGILLPTTIEPLFSACFIG